MSDNRLFRLSALTAVLLPAGFLAGTILMYGVNVPYWDQWEVANLVVKVFDGTLSLGDLTFQQNESRLVFPRLLFIGLAYLTGYDVRYEMWGSFCLACLVAYNVYRLGRLTLGGNRRQVVFLLFLASLLIFSLVQWENWFWGIQFSVFVPIACVTSILSLAYSSLSVGTKFAVSAILSTVSMFSFAHGMMCWVIVLPVLVLRTQEELKTKRWLIGCWLLVFAVTAGLYFFNYTKPPHHPSFTEALVKLPAALGYFLALLGGPLGWGTKLNSLYQAIAVGSGLAALFVLLCVYVWRHRNEPLVVYRTLAWLTLGGYTWVSAGVTTLGRLGLGIDTALSSRYGTFAIPLIVALIYLVPIALDIDRKEKSLSLEPWMTRCAILLSTVLLFLHVATTRSALARVKTNWEQRLEAKAVLLFIGTLPSESLARTMYPGLEALKRYAAGLDRHGLLSPGLRKSLTISNHEQLQTAAAGECGWFDFLERKGQATYFAKGWAVHSDRHEPADGIVLGYEESDGSFAIFDLVVVRTRRPDIAQVFRRRRTARAGWEHFFALPQVSGKPLKIAAWAVDANTGRLCKLRKTHVVDAQEAMIREVER
jgi:hypothetical protein